MTELHPELEAALRAWRAEMAHRFPHLTTRGMDLYGAIDALLPGPSLLDQVEAVLPREGWERTWSDGGCGAFKQEKTNSLSWVYEDNPNTPEDIVAALKVLAARGE